METEVTPFTPLEFCADLTRDLVTANPADRKPIAAGYARILELRVDAERKDAVEEYKWQMCTATPVKKL